MPVSVRSAEGISSWDVPSVLLMVTFLETGAPSFSQMTSGQGEAYKEYGNGIFFQKTKLNHNIFIDMALCHP